MKNKPPKGQSGELLIVFVLIFVVLRTLFAFIWDVSNVELPIEITDDQSRFISPVEFLIAYIRAFTNTSTWTQSFVGVLLGALFPILISLSIRFLSRTNILQSRLFKEINLLFSRINTLVEKWLDSLQKQVSQVTRIWEKVVDRILLFVTNIILGLWGVIVALIKSLQSSIQTPKWYKNQGAIDPGLIEVSLAITAIVIAVPVFANNALVGDSWLRIISVAIPTGVSLSFIDLYAKDKGSKSIFVLLSPIGDGPFFFLGWAILIVSFFAIIVFAYLGY